MKFFNTSWLGNTGRQRVFLVLGVSLFLVVAGRLFYLQVIKADVFMKESRKNAIRDIPIIPIRGNMYDRHDQLVIDSYPFYSLTVTPRDYQPEQTGLLIDLLQTDSATFHSKLDEARRYSPFVPSVLFRDVPYPTMVTFEESAWKLRGVSYRVDTKRNYPGVMKGSHLFGYLAEVTPDIIRTNPEFYALGDMTGGSGLEKFYESALRGVKGHEFWLVNATGQLVGELDNGSLNMAPVNGDDLFLTIDDGLQAYAERLMEGKAGGAVAIDPRSGEILAMVSKPDFDLTALSGLKNSAFWRDLVSDPTKPLFNRATLTRYPPGSTFKPLMAAAALEEGVITETTKLNCNGIFYFGNRGFKCHGGRHGAIDVRTAIQKSCNSFFYQLALKIPLDRLHAYGLMFGLGRVSELDLYEQRAGLIPNTTYYNRVYGPNGWTRGFLVSLGIGQGEIGISPLQSAMMTATIANGGIYYQPHLVRKIYRKQTGKTETLPIISRRIPISESNLKIVQDGMAQVVEAGTARGTKLPDIRLAGKTGTAQNPHGEDHSWFVCFGPVDSASIAIAVMIENGGFGAVSALPIARQMLKYYFYGPDFIKKEEEAAARISSQPVLKTRSDSLRFAD
ncbi:MAG: penicillin-binding protein 2 [Bacteroidetes bacterium]|nr:penicillin-binding protein 2 [Bacteroidota bacterium]